MLIYKFDISYFIHSRKTRVHGLPKYKGALKISSTAGYQYRQSLWRATTRKIYTKNGQVKCEVNKIFRVISKWTTYSTTIANFIAPTTKR
jgi:hypothetical protein